MTEGGRTVQLHPVISDVIGALFVNFEPALYRDFGVGGIVSWAHVVQAPQALGPVDRQGLEAGESARPAGPKVIVAVVADDYGVVVVAMMR